MSNLPKPGLLYTLYSQLGSIVRYWTPSSQCVALLTLEHGIINPDSCCLRSYEGAIPLKAYRVACKGFLEHDAVKVLCWDNQVENDVIGDNPLMLYSSLFT